MNAVGEPVPLRQVRAHQDADTLVVYQAYGHEIADAAVAAGRFVAPFKTSRMTWIKPSFLWMMYRCGWASKPGQERVLAVRITRSGFEEALARSSLSRFDEAVHASRESWEAELRASPVRIQWDPERDLALNPLPYRSIQVGLGQDIVPEYVSDWLVELNDITDTVHSIASLVRDGATDEARALLPRESVLTVPAESAARAGMTH